MRARTADSGAVVDISATKSTSPLMAPPADEPSGSSIDSANVVTLAAGHTWDDKLPIIVTAANAVETKTYIVTVTRAAFNASDDASLVNGTLILTEVGDW